MRKTIPSTCVAVLLAVPSLLLAGPDPAPPARPAPTTEHAAERAYIGVNMDPATDRGVPISRVHPDTPAERFGLVAGDVILRIDETRADSLGTVADALATRRPGDTIEIEVLRSDEPRTIRLELGVRPADLELRRDRADHVLDVLQVRPGLDVADIGCGSGWLAEAIAIEFDGNGTVYAVELDEGYIDSLKRRALPGVVPILSEPGDVSLPEESLDIAMLHDVASHVDPDARASFYESVRRALRPGARLLVFGPHGEAESMLAVLREHGFIPVDEHALDGLPTEDLDRRLDEGIAFAPSEPGRTDRRE